MSTTPPMGWTMTDDLSREVYGGKAYDPRELLAGGPMVTYKGAPVTFDTKTDYSKFLVTSEEEKDRALAARYRHLRDTFELGPERFDELVDLSIKRTNEAEALTKSKFWKGGSPKGESTALPDITAAYKKHAADLKANVTRNNALLGQLHADATRHKTQLEMLAQREIMKQQEARAKAMAEEDKVAMQRYASEAFEPYNDKGAGPFYL